MSDIVVSLNIPENEVGSLLWQYLCMNTALLCDSLSENVRIPNDLNNGSV